MKSTCATPPPRPHGDLLCYIAYCGFPSMLPDLRLGDGADRRVTFRYNLRYTSCELNTQC